jgi:hypothetical protein
MTSFTRFGGGRKQNNFDLEDEIHYPTRPVDKDKAEQELVVNIKKATSPEESAPKQKHVRSTPFHHDLVLELTPFQSASSLPGITIHLYRFGVDSVSNLSLLMKYKPSRVS